MEEPPKITNKQPSNNDASAKVKTENVVSVQQKILAKLVKNTLQVLLGFVIILLFLSIAKLIIHYFQRSSCMDPKLESYLHL